MHADGYRKTGRQSQTQKFVRDNGDLMSTLIVLAIIVVFLIVFERRKINATMIALTAGLSVVSALGRIPFAGVPGVQLTTFLVMVSGFSLGPMAGLTVGAASALVSNLFLGQGPWTVWQMLAWGMAGMSAGLAGRFRPNAGKLELAIYCGLWGYLFGWIMNLWTWSSYIYPHDIRTFLAVCASSLWFDTLHAAANVIWMLLFGKEFIRIITRFKNKAVLP